MTTLADVNATLGVTNIEAVLQPPPQPMPMNPAKENQEALKGQG